MAQPKPGLELDQTALERLENSCAATLPIQPDRALEDLQRQICRDAPHPTQQGFRGSAETLPIQPDRALEDLQRLSKYRCAKLVV